MLRPNHQSPPLSYGRNDAEDEGRSHGRSLPFEDYFQDISLKAGGFGLNLTAANYVIHLDPWWNPAVEDQASDRAHRIGQLLPVTVYRLIARDTIEEKILRLHADKRELADQLLADTDQAGRHECRGDLGPASRGRRPIRRVSERSKPSALGARVLQDTALSMARPTSQATGTRVPAGQIIVGNNDEIACLCDRIPT